MGSCWYCWKTIKKYKCKKSNIKGIMLLLICVLILLLGYHGYSHYMVSKFYKFVDAGNTEGAISCVEKMPNVNMLDKCRPLYNIEGILLQYSTTEGYINVCVYCNHSYFTNNNFGF